MVEIFDNIKKIYRFSAPMPELADYIEFLSESLGEDTARVAGDQGFFVKMFASWTPTFWINLGTSYHLSMGDDCYLIEPDHDILVLRDSIVTRHNQPTDHIFTVKFFPGGLEAIFGISQTKFINEVVDLRHVLPGWLLQSVRMAMSFDERLDLIQQFLLENWLGQSRKDHYIQLVNDSIDLYEAGSMGYNVSEVAERMFITSKTINRYFNDVVGTSPRKYFSILRARAALTAYVGGKGSFVPDNFGYYDMSHFYKEMVGFTGRNIAVQQTETKLCGRQE